MRPVLILVLLLSLSACKTTELLFGPVTEFNPPPSWFSENGVEIAQAPE